MLFDQDKAHDIQNFLLTTQLYEIFYKMSN